MAAAAVESSRATRIILLIAALVAIAAVAIALWKRQVPAPSAPASTAQDAPADLASTIARLEAQLRRNPADVQGWRALGWALFRTGKFAEAASAYARAVQIDPNRADDWSALGEARVMAGPGDVPAGARQAFEKAVALDPKDPRARYFLGVAKDIAGDHKGAIADWLALLSDTPPGAPWEADVRRLIIDVGAREKIDVTGRLAAIRPRPPSGGAAIARAAIPGPSAGDMRAAAQLPKGQQDAMIQGMVDGLEAKLRSNPRNAEGWIMLMRSRMSLGETAKASAAYRGAQAAFAGDSGTRAQIDAAAQALGIR
jgi:cytochrome c-type biogenesis protein CcmH